MIIYKITNLINGKNYIGKQIRYSKTYLGSGKLITLAIKKYGKVNFSKEILEECYSKKELNTQEVFWIKKLNSIRPNGYNIGKGGEGGDTFLNSNRKKEYKENSKNATYKLWKNPIYREKVLTARKGNKLSEETKKKISDSNKKPKSESHKKALSLAWQKRKIQKPHTKETLEKMSNSMKGKNVGKYIKIYQFKGPNGKIYTTSKGLVKFAKEFKKHPGSFRDLIQGKKTEYHGWTFIKTIK